MPSTSSTPRLSGARIRRRRDHLGLTQERVLELMVPILEEVGVDEYSQPWLSNIEHDGTGANPKARVVEALAVVLQVAVGWLFGEGSVDRYEVLAQRVAEDAEDYDADVPAQAGAFGVVQIREDV